jgi:hypothetical protein
MVAAAVVFAVVAVASAVVVLIHIDMRIPALEKHLE